MLNTCQKGLACRKCLMLEPSLLLSYTLVGPSAGFYCKEIPVARELFYHFQVFHFHLDRFH